MPKEKKMWTRKLQDSTHTKTSGSRTKTKPGTSHATNTDTVTLASLAQTEHETWQKWSQADNTKINYKGYVAHAARFLDCMVLAWQNRHSATGIDKDYIDTDLLAQVFNNPPNKYSVMALLNFLTQKCFIEQHGKSTGQGIQAAMARMWDKMDGQKYTGDHYHFDKSTGIITGNPACAPSVKEDVKCINMKSSTKGAAAYSKHECSCEELEKSTVSVQELTQMIKYGLVRAFFTLGFTLWTRNFELCGLQAHNIKWDLQGPAPYNVPYFRVHLDGHKGWQSKQGWEGPLESNYHNIYVQPNSPDIDMYTYLPQWISLLERCLGHKLEPNDYIFPYYLAYTTHSLCCGGAQYQFMFAPIGQWWSLSMIQYYKSGHSDALYPIPKEVDKTFMEDHVLEKPVTTAKFCVFADAILSWLSQSQPTSICQVHAHAALPSSFVNPSTILSHTVCKAAENTQSQILMPTLLNSNFTLMAEVSSQRSPEGATSSMDLPYHAQAPPIPDVVIPDIGKGPGAWNKAVKQWEEGDSAQGLLPLQDWPKEWYTGSQ
ncbi:hypothetical protein EDD18DRAFT_1311680 [Armillaria luteobubalina]|uniref:Ndc10 domain-containing protein n=1 Tax=Armillaria luteobubalina TaxID=153913 RepID=A0AA39PKJ0_9AGAR|nr:hypothetical protein EDD18DRAFT_1311680 [Armillaria luteobubalina]